VFLFVVFAIVVLMLCYVMCTRCVFIDIYVLWVCCCCLFCIFVYMIIICYGSVFNIECAKVQQISDLLFFKLQLVAQTHKNAYTYYVFWNIECPYM